MSGSLSLAQSLIRSADHNRRRSTGGQTLDTLVTARLERKVTREEVLLCIDEVVRGFVNLNLTLPGLRHIPNAWIAGYDVELRSSNTAVSIQYCFPA